jgi:hypothetical protein
MRVRLVSLLGALVVSLAFAPSARADGFVEPFAGVTFGGTADTQRYVYGGRVGFVGNAAGFEVDFGYAPNFFSGSDKFADFNGKLNITTLMANLLIGGAPHRGGVRPYVVGGFGLMRGLVHSPNDFFSDVTRNDFGFDVRYFRSLTGSSDNGFLLDPTQFDLGDFSFWRATGGVLFRF